VGLGLCCLAVLTIWWRFRIDRLTGWDLLRGLLFYVLAGVVIWHGFTVAQKLLDTNQLL
jgi:hypothetical protein